MFGVLNRAQAATSAMKGCLGAMICSVFSVGEGHGVATWSIYCATKFALIGFTARCIKISVKKVCGIIEATRHPTLYREITSFVHSSFAPKFGYADADRSRWAAAQRCRLFRRFFEIHKRGVDTDEQSFSRLR
ncbi:SDR family NAD(P)-dependent oxidoreductase [Caballeronia sp. SEWSISQ10-4 2]|uniref:SDR family NAD(P)-dependent oxidoreductase n=1 Tax=Caballeronia sp. SEWSISQ10-4 2 TaxID=2937438 RepID=UPI00346196A7